MLNVKEIPFDDQYTWDLLSSGNTKGIFQLETHTGQTWSAKVKPQNIEELSALISVLRPGSLRAKDEDGVSMSTHYAQRKNHLEETKSLFTYLDSILAPTYQCMVYQEQAMQIAVKVAGFNEQEADELRSAIGKKKADKMAKVKEKFITKAKTYGVATEEEAQQIFGWIEKSQKYSFCHSHGVGYAKLAYITAYLKTHFTLDFFTAWLQKAFHKQDPKREIAELVRDTKKFNIVVLPPYFPNDSKHFYNDGTYIYFGLNDVRQIGVAVYDKIIKNQLEVSKIIGKSTIQWDWLDFLIHFSDKIASTAVEALISCGALDYYGLQRSRMLFEYQIWGRLTVTEKNFIITQIYQGHDLTNLESLLRLVQPVRKLGGGTANVKRSAFVADLIVTLHNPPTSLEDKIPNIVAMETKYLGVCISGHKADGANDQYSITCTCKEFSEKIIKDEVSFGVELKEVKAIKTKKGQDMAFLTVEDSSGELNNIVVFSDQWEEFQWLLIEQNTVILTGQRGKTGSLVVRAVRQA